MVVSDYITLTLFLKLLNVAQSALQFLPNSHQPKQKWANSGTTGVKSTKPSLSVLTTMVTL